MRFICIILLFLYQQALAAIHVVDDTGATLDLSKPAKRIIVLAPDATETMFEIGAGQYIIGIVNGADYPPETMKIPLVGSYTGLDLEKIVSLKPDLIIVWRHTFVKQITALKKLGFPVYTTHIKNLENISQTMTNFGVMTGKNEQAAKRAKRFDQILAQIREDNKNKKKVRVFYQIGTTSLITINRDSWINQALDICGGENVFANAFSIAPEISWEAFVSANPSLIISDNDSDTLRKRWMKWQSVSAVKNNMLFSIDPDLIERAGPRMVSGVKKICSYLDKARDRSSAS